EQAGEAFARIAGQVAQAQARAASFFAGQGWRGGGSGVGRQLDVGKGDAADMHGAGGEDLQPQPRDAVGRGGRVDGAKAHLAVEAGDLHALTRSVPAVDGGAGDGLPA